MEGGDLVNWWILKIYGFSKGFELAQGGSVTKGATPFSLSKSSLILNLYNFWIIFLIIVCLFLFDHGPLLPGTT